MTQALETFFKEMGLHNQGVTGTMVSVAIPMGVKVPMQVWDDLPDNRYKLTL